MKDEDYQSLPRYRVLQIIAEVRPHIDAVIAGVFRRAETMPHEAYGVPVAPYAFMDDRTHGYIAPYDSDARHYFDSHRFYPHRYGSDTIEETLTQGIALDSIRAKSKRYKPMPEDAVALFMMFATPDQINLLRGISEETTERLTGILVVGLPKTAGRIDVINAFQRYFQWSREDAIKAVDASPIERYGARFGVKTDDPVYRAFNAIAANANDRKMFWLSMHGVLWDSGFKFDTPGRQAFRDFINAHVPTSHQKKLLDAISAEEAESKHAKKAGGRMVDNRNDRPLDLRNITQDLRSFFEEEAKSPKTHYRPIPKPAKGIRPTVPNEPVVAAAKPSLVSSIAIKKRNIAGP